MKKILILFVLVVSVILGTPNTKTTVTSVRNNVTVSIPNGEISKTSNVNDETKKEISKLKLEIKVLRDQLTKQEEENKKKEQQLKQDLEQKINEKIEKNINLTYSIDQIYSTSKSHYELSTEKVEKLYSESFSNYNNLITAFLTGLGILVGFTVFIKLDDSKKMKELKDELLDDMKDKKEEIEKNIEKRLETIIMCINEIVNSKMSELKEIKDKIEILEKDAKDRNKNLISLIDEWKNEYTENFNLLNKTFDQKMKDLEIKNIDLEAKLREFIEIEKKKIQKDLMEDYNTNVVCEIKNMKLKLQNMEEGSKINEENEINIEPEGMNTSDKIIRIIKKLYRKKEYSKAKNILEKNYSKEDYNINYWLGLVNYRLFKYAEAIYYLNIAKNICPNKIKEYYVNYWLGMVTSKNKSYEDAIKYFHEAVKLAPKDSNKYNSYYQLGYANSMISRCEESIMYLKEAEKYALTKEDKYNVYHELGVSYLLKCENQVGIKYFQRAIEETDETSLSNKYKTLSWLGVAFYFENEYLKALTYLEDVEKNKQYYLSNDNEWIAKCYYQLALKSFELDQTKAKNYINKSLDYDSGNKEALELKEKIDKMPDNLDNKTEE